MILKASKASQEKEVNKNEAHIFITCDDMCGAVEINTVFDDDDEFMYLSFWIPRFYAHQGGIWDMIKYRVKTAFRILSKGDYFLQELLMSVDEAKEIRDYFNDVLPEGGESLS